MGEYIDSCFRVRIWIRPLRKDKENREVVHEKGSRLASRTKRGDTFALGGDENIRVSGTCSESTPEVEVLGK